METAHMGNDSPRSKLLDLLQSVAGAAIGIQSNKKRERDFSSGHPGRYVIAGLIATAIFVATMYLVVRIVLRSAGV
jgi:hypothetical protein